VTTSFDIRVLAKRINARRKEYAALHPGKAVPISDTMSRILEHDADYIPTRKRRRTKVRPPLQSPGIAVLVEIANSLETTVADLLGERGAPLTPHDHRVLSAAVRILVHAFDLDVPQERHRG
jgi:hypothetical protein